MPNDKQLYTLITKPDGQQLAERIDQIGGEAYYFPTIAYVPAADETEFQQGLQQIVTKDWLIFISPRAVQASVPALLAVFKKWPEKIKTAAVGAVTAQTLKNYHINVDAVPEQQWNSEGLLDLPVFQNIANQQIVIVRGGVGRETLEVGLKSRGASVSFIEAYQRILPQHDTTQLLRLIENHQLQAIICTSYTALQNLLKLLDDKVKPALITVPLIVSSQRIKILAQDLGFQTIWVASNAGDTAILEAYHRYCGTKGTKHD